MLIQKPWFFSSSSAVPQELVVQLTTTAQANFEPAGSELSHDFPCFPRKMIYKLQVFHSNAAVARYGIAAVAEIPQTTCRA